MSSIHAWEYVWTNSDWLNNKISRPLKFFFSGIIYGDCSPYHEWWSDSWNQSLENAIKWGFYIFY